MRGKGSSVIGAFIRQSGDNKFSLQALRSTRQVLLFVNVFWISFYIHT
jgi:hypothetical protein